MKKFAERDLVSDTSPAMAFTDDWEPSAPGAQRGRRLALIVWATLAIALVGGAVAWSSARGRHSTAHFTTAEVTRGPIESKVTASGTLSALVTVQVGSQVSGRIAQILVDFNSPVRKGQVLARIDPQLFKAALAQAKANDQAARAGLRKAQVAAADLDRQADRAEALAREHFGALADAQTARANAQQAHAQIAQAQASVAQARANLEQARINLAYTTIVSPIDGTVISRNVDVGQTVAASLAAPTLFVIAQDLRKLQVDTSVSEADVGRLTKGMPATFTVDAYPNRPFQGVVRQIRYAPQVVQNVVTYDTVVDVANPKLALKPGMTANVTFIDASRENALLIPNAALRFRPPLHRLGKPRDRSQPKPRAHAESNLGSPTRVVWKLEDAHPEPVRVKLGISDGLNTEVLGDSLRAGDLVLTGEDGVPTGAPRARSAFRMF